MSNPHFLDLLKELKSQVAYQKILQAFGSGELLPGQALPRAVRLPLVAAMSSDLLRPVLFITDKANHAAAYLDELRYWAPATPRYIFSEPNPLFYEDASWGSVTRGERLQALSALAVYHLPSRPFEDILPPVIITSARALMTKTIGRRDFLKATIIIQTKGFYHLNPLIINLVNMGYERKDTVLEPGEFSRRGGLLELWPPTEPNPIRLDFFGNALESIRCFDPASQRTINSCEWVLVTPAREFILPGEHTDEFQVPPSEFNIPLLHPFSSCFLDYLPKGSPVLVDDLALLESAVTENEEQAVRFRNESIKEGLLPEDFPVPYFTWPELADRIEALPHLELGHSTAAISDKVDEREFLLAGEVKPIERFGGRLKQFFEYVAELLQRGNKVFIVSRQSSRLRELWKEQRGELDPSLFFFDTSLSAGWSLNSLLLITDSEIFGWEKPQPRTRPRQSTDAPEIVYADLDPGDWVVHIDYGIGRFGGLVKRSLDGIEREFLCVEYRDGDQVYVPIHQADRITRYIGPGGGDPVPGNLGTQEWHETKRKVREVVQDVARDLLDLYARRQIAEGFAFSLDTPWQQELESSFPYVETPDQVKALEEVKRDMELPRPMDRLLCGDVGYGKTEVALRAAFKAVMDGKQAAVLVPTTVLAQQHFDTFRQRLSAFPVSVEMLSRFRTPREQAQVLIGLAQGGIDIVIGTHRLLSVDVHFKDLGLLIIDEEQRFGVTHKERLKEMRSEMDVLTLTATPIPRTLYMALTGVRDISSLNTPPEERLPIITHIGPYSPKLVRQAVIRELERGGQVFFVHNRVQTIHAMRMHLEKLVPEARIAIGHGQMPEQELASVMHRFTGGEIDILLATSIIESGLDIPNANTLIVDRGDAFGLAQLYQLRGRVGRGAVRAYAYFFRHRKLAPTQEGQERLEVIAENTQLGAGYSIAMRDLEMRGAGELLGTRQSGHIAAVGFHLYTRLLAMAVNTLRKERAVPEPVPSGGLALAEIGFPVNVDLPLDAGIPEDYVPDQALRLRLYRRLADIADESGLDAFSAEILDRFGKPPDMVDNLFFQMKVKILAERIGLVSVGCESGQIILRYPSTQDGKSAKRLNDLDRNVRGGKNAYWCSIMGEPNWKAKLIEILGEIGEKQQRTG